MKMSKQGFGAKQRFQYVQLNSGNFVLRDNRSGKVHVITSVRTQQNLKRIASIKNYFAKYRKERAEHPALPKKAVEQIVIDHEKNVLKSPANLKSALKKGEIFV